MNVPYPCSPEVAGDWNEVNRKESERFDESEKMACRSLQNGETALQLAE